MSFLIYYRIVDVHGHRRRTTSQSSRDPQHMQTLNEKSNETDQPTDTDTETVSTVPKEKRDHLINPYWIEDSGLRNGNVEYISAAENSFWKDMLKKYLYPIDEDPQEKVFD